jgi:hypothetical protein
LAASVTLLALLAVSVVVWGGGDDSVALATPPAPSISPGVETLTVTWSSPPATGPSTTAEVRSFPIERACVISGTHSCTVADVNDDTPWTFSVREEIAGTWTGWSARSKPVPHVSIFVVAGQSNATGWESTAIDATSHANVLTSSASPADTHFLIAWDQPGALEPVRVGFAKRGPVPLLTPQMLIGSGGTDQPATQIFGPEISFARGLYDAGVHSGVILKVTMGGSRLGDGGPWNPTNGELFESLVADAHDLERWEAAHGRLATIGAFIWYQGEADATPEYAPSYEENLTSFIVSIRHDLDTGSATPFLVVKSSTADYVTTEEKMGLCNPSGCAALRAANQQVRAADDAVAAALPHVSLVDSALLPRTGFLIHLSTQGELLLGSLLAARAIAAGVN